MSKLEEMYPKIKQLTTELRKNSLPFMIVILGEEIPVDEEKHGHQGVVTSCYGGATCLANAVVAEEIRQAQKEEVSNFKLFLLEFMTMYTFLASQDIKSPQEIEKETGRDDVSKP